MINILVPLDGSEPAEQALNHAISIAKAFPAELTLMRVIAETESSTPGPLDSLDLALWRHQAQTYLSRLIEKHSDKGLVMRALVSEGNPARTITRFMRAARPDLLVLTRYGRGNANDFSAGGTVQKIVSSATCSVLLLDPRQPFNSEESYQRVVIPIDDSKDSDCAVAVGSMIAEISGASLLLLYAVEASSLPKAMPDTRHSRQLVAEMRRLIEHEAQKRLRELATWVPKTIGVNTRVLIASDLPIAIESAAEDFDGDLLLLHAVDGSAGSFGEFSSVNNSLIQYSYRPLFIFRPHAGEGLTSNFRSVYLDDQHLQAG